MIEEFRKYVENFDFNDKNIERKYYHSLRVKSLCQLIAKDLGFSDEDAKIAEVVGLLHDYGRFKQWTIYHTYRDLDSIDHADYGVRELFDNGEIANFWTNKEDYDEIYDAIKYHNKINIPENLSEHNKLLCKVVRDADKLDIMYLYVSNTLLFEEDGDISPKVKESFDNQKTVNRKDQKTEADNIILLLAFVYDLNFDYSFKHLKKHKILNQLYEIIKDKDKYKYYFDAAIRFVEEKINSI